MISDFSQCIEVKRIVLAEGFGFGEPTKEEKTVLKTKYAKIRELSRKEAVMQSMSVENRNYEVKIRYHACAEVLKDDIIVWNGKRLKAVTSGRADEIDKKKFIVIMAIYQNG